MRISKKIVALIIALMMTLSCVSALADSVTDLIIGIPTTQAFSDSPVDQDDLLTIVKAGLAAASAINQQPWYFAVITSKDIMNQVNNGVTAAAPAAEEAPAEEAASDGASAGAPAGETEGEAAASDGASAGAPAGETEGEAAAPANDGARAGGSAGGSAGGAAGAKAGLGDSPVAIIIYMNTNSMSPDPNFDCGLCCQNMVIAANALGYGTKIVTAPTGTLNGARHDEICNLLGVDTSLKAVGVLLIGYPDVDAESSASVRETVDVKVNFLQ